MINEVLLVGRAGQNAEARNTRSGKKIVTASIATDYWRGKGDRVTTWHRIVAFNYQAEDLEAVAKGDLVLIKGRINANEYTDRSGNKRTSFEIVAEKVKTLQGSGQSRSRDAEPDEPDVFDGFPEDDGDDDLPF